MDGNAKRQLTLVGFMQAQNCSLLTASWRHPETARDFLSAEYYQRMARALERARFHLAFFDDRLAMPDIYKGNHELAVRHGIRPVKMDPVPVLCMMAAATTHLGLGATCSTTYYEPFHVARLFQTLDNMTGGRAAWNVVTSLNSSEAANFGQASHLEHDKRYDRADEFMEVVLGHWNSWDDDAIVLDKAARVFANPQKVRRLSHEGEYFRSEGPFTVPRSPQGQPVIIQAGQSGRGAEFASRWAELIFCIYPNIEVGKRAYQKLKEQISASGRNADAIKITPAAYVVSAETKAMAEDKIALIDKLTEETDGLVLLSENLSYDFGAKEIDEPFTTEELESLNGMRALRDRVLLLSKKQNPTVRDFITYSRKGSIHEQPLFYGTGKDIADQMEQWLTERACDGFVIPATHIPGTYEEFALHVTPELQRRGLLHKEYAGKTLRENLGLQKT